jgi:glycosyltransferase involved in cell wall biosynthesis
MRMASARLDLSIVIPTIGRKEQIVRLIDSIYMSSIDFISYEIVIVNQNREGFFDGLLDKFVNIVIYQVDFKGLSRAKNFGFSKSRGEYIIFLDDDSKVFPDSFSTAFDIIRKYNYDLVCGKCIDEYGKDSVQVFRKGSMLISPKNFNGAFIEATCFIKRGVLEKYKYDENLGAGVLFGAHEGYDWLLDVLNSDEYSCYYCDRVKFYHPQILIDKGDLSSLIRVNSYTYGFIYSRLKKKRYHEIIARFFYVSFAFLFFFFLNRKKRNYYLVETCSIIIGVIYTKSSTNFLK